MKLDKKRGVGGAALLLVAVVLWVALSDGGEPVRVATTVTDTLSVSVTAEGRTRARDPYTVTAPVAGWLTRIPVQEGDEVDAGQVLARILPSPQDPRTAAALGADVEAARAMRVEAEASLARAAVQAEQARREAERRTALAEEGSLSREVIEQARTQAALAERTRASAEAALEAASANLAAAEARVMGASGDASSGPAVAVTAPVAGRILRIPDRSARVVPAGTPLMEMADVGGLEVVFDVLSQDAVRIEPGQEIRITEWGGDGVLEGTVRTVTRAGYTRVSALGVEEQRVDVVGDLSHIPSALGTGYRVAGEIVTSRASDVLAVPTSGLFRSDGAWAVYAVVNGRAVRREVTLGLRNAERAEVVEGLVEGDQVVLFPPATLSHGAEVRPLP
jgi:HlyD family secretion protein